MRVTSPCRIGTGDPKPSPVAPENGLLSSKRFCSSSASTVRPVPPPAMTDRVFAKTLQTRPPAVVTWNVAHACHPIRAIAGTRRHWWPRAATSGTRSEIQNEHSRARSFRSRHANPIARRSRLLVIFWTRSSGPCGRLQWDQGIMWPGGDERSWHQKMVEALKTKLFFGPG
jgi:hypothetical protein